MLALGLVYFCIVIGVYGLSFWMPQVIQTYGLDPLQIGLLTAIPYFFAAIAMVLWARIPTGLANASGTSRCQCSSAA